MSWTSSGTLGAAYRDHSLATASPAKLVVMLYDRLALDLVRAEESLREGRSASDHLLHAQDIVLELLTSLDLSAWDGAATLSAIYTFLHGELVRANIRSDLEVVTSCRQLVEPLRDAWHAAAVAASAPTRTTEAPSGPLSAIA